MKKALNITKKVFCVLLVLVGLALIFHQSISNLFVSKQAEAYTKNLTVEKIISNKEKKADFNPENVTALTSADLVSNHYTDLPVIGSMVIPELELNLPIFKGLDNANLSVGAGTMRDDIEMGQGNYSLASHSIFDGYNSSKLLFTPLHRAQLGQRIYLKDEANVYTYEITNIFQVNPSDGYVINDVLNETLITLVTCTDLEATQRLIIQGKFIEKLSIEDTPEHITSYFEQNWTRFW